MMGVGKSTIGKSLAKKLSFNFVDMDHLVEMKEGCSINMIFKKKGEDYFRDLEKKLTLKELDDNFKKVIALGGGAFLNKSIRGSIKNKAISFWLDVNPVLLIKRLKKTKKRPLLFNKKLSETVKKIYLERKKIYSKADYRIKCNSLRKEIIINKIIKLYKNERDKI